MRRPSIALLIVLVVLAVAVLGWMLIRKGFSARDNPSALEAYVAQRVRHMAVPAEAKYAKNPFQETPNILAEARAHFADHCALCHANDGSGQTTIGQHLYPKAPDMRQPQTQNLSDGEIYYIIHNGIRLTGMPAWGDPRHDEDSWKLVHFIRHLPKLTPEEIREMEHLNPKGPEEREEEKLEQEFLHGEEVVGKQPKHHN